MQCHLPVCLMQHFDTDNSGYLTRDELADALRSSALDESQLQGDVDKVLQECDKSELEGVNDMITTYPHER